MELIMIPVQIVFGFLKFLGSIGMLLWNWLFYCQPREGYYACRADDWHVNWMNLVILITAISVLWALWQRSRRKKN